MTLEKKKGFLPQPYFHHDRNLSILVVGKTKVGGTFLAKKDKTFGRFLARRFSMNYREIPSLSEAGQ